MAYSIVGHVLLSPEAAALDNTPAGALLAQQRVAELVLGLRDTEYPGSAKQDAEDALAMQVSLQVAADPMAFLATDETEGIQKVTWRGGIPVHPLALTIVEQLAADAVTDETVVLPRQSATVPLLFGW